MIIRKLPALFLIVYLTLFCGKYSTLSQVQLQSEESSVKDISFQREIKLVRTVNVLKHGDAGIITIQGIPNTRYTLRSSFRTANRTIPVTQWRTTDANGLATFNWVVGNTSVPGTYAITVSGGGDSVELTHTVLP